MPIAPKRLKLQISNLTYMFPGTVRRCPPNFVQKGGVARSTWPLNFGGLNTTSFKMDLPCYFCLHVLLIQKFQTSVKTTLNAWRHWVHRAGKPRFFGKDFTFFSFLKVFKFLGFSLVYKETGCKITQEEHPVHHSSCCMILGDRPLYSPKPCICSYT